MVGTSGGEQVKRIQAGAARIRAEGAPMEKKTQPHVGTGRKRAFVLFASIMLGAAGVLLAAGTAGAHDDHPPKTVLMKQSRELQAGRLTDEYEWSYPSPNGKACRTDEVTIPFAFARGLPTVAVGSRLKVRVHKSQRPRSFTIAEIDRDGQPWGKVGTRLRPVVRDGRTVAWEAAFTVDRPNTLYRLLSEGHWQDRDCTVADPIDPDQFARWSIRVKTGGLPGTG